MVPRILVVDDEHDVRECVTGLLSLIPGSHVEGAATFAEGCARAAEQPWDLVISDFSLPDGNGVALLEDCVRSHPYMARVLMTAFAGHPRVIEARESRRFSEFIEKPFDPERFLQRMEGLLQGAAQRRGRPAP